MSPVTPAPSKPAPSKPAPNKAAKTAPPPKPKPKPGEDDEEDDVKSYGLTHTDLAARCPNCAELMESEDAVICLHCGYNTMTRTLAKTRKVQDITGGDIFLWLLPGILCVVAIVLLIVFDIVYWVKIGDWVDTTGIIGGLLAHKGIKIWLGIMSAFFIYGLGHFAIKRLFINNRPPEVELTK